MQDAFTELVSEELAEVDAVDPRRPPAQPAAPPRPAAPDHRRATAADRAGDVEDGEYEVDDDLVVEGAVVESNGDVASGGGGDSSSDRSNDTPEDPAAADEDPGRDGLVDDLMIRATDTPSSDLPAATPAAGEKAVLPQLRGKHVCPFCGTVREQDHDHPQAACPKCTMSDSPQTRQATKARIGPWFVRQTRNPAAPGMKFETLLSLVKRGQVASHSVVRGPTTHQLWRFAANVKGLSREFGLCYSCAAAIERTTNLCPHCNRLQEPPANPDVLLESAGSPPAAPAAPPAAPAAAALTLPVQREVKPHPTPKPVAVAPPPGPAPARPPTKAPRPAAPTAPAAAAPVPAAVVQPLTPPPPAPAVPPAPLAKEEPAAAPAAPARPSDTSPPPLHASFGRPADGTMASVLQAASVASPARSRNNDAGPVPLNPESTTAAPREPRRPPRRDPRPQQRQEPPAAADAAGRPDMLLTAEELAAAFQLDFKPAAAAARARRQTGPGQRRRRIPLGKLVAALLLLGIGGGAIALAVLPDVRRDAFNWAQDTYASLRETVDGNAKPPMPVGRTTASQSPAPSPPSSTTNPPPDALAARPAAPVVEPATRPAQAPPPPPQQPSQPQPSQQAMAGAIPPAVVTPPPPVLAAPVEPKPPVSDPMDVVRDAVNRPIEAVAASKQDVAPAPKAEAPKPQPPQPDAPKPAPPAAAAAKPMDPALAYDRAIVLWRQALDAEQAGNYAEAVQTYEELQKLPKEVWPGGLEINLKIARRRLGREG
jgi:hypothetical protein